MKKILYILHSYNNKGGTEEHTKTLVKGLSGKLDCWIVFPEKKNIVLVHNNQICDEFLGDNLNPLELNYRNIKIETVLSRILDKIKPDIVHIQHILNWPLGILDQLCLWKRQDESKKIHFTFHDFFPLTPDYALRGSFDHSEIFTEKYSEFLFKTNLLSFLVTRKNIIFNSLQNITSTIVPSSFLLKVYKCYLSNKLNLIEHGIDILPKLPKKNSSLIRIGYFGGMLPQKGINTFLSSVNELLINNENLAFQIYGNGTDQLVSNNNKNIKFLGIYEKEFIPEIYSNLDFVVIPSEFPETFSLVLSESWSQNVPAICSNIGVFKDRIKKGVNGEVFIPSNKSDLIETLQNIINNQSWLNWKIPQVRTEDEMIIDYLKLYGNE